MNPFNSYFSKIYCINRASRGDRWAKMQQQFTALGIEVERFNAIEGGEKGCAASHIAVIKDAHVKRYKRILILEDDAEFLVADMEYYAELFKNMPQFWHLLYLGGNCTTKLKRRSEYLFEAKQILCCHAYAVSEGIYTQILADARLGKVRQIDTYLIGKVQPRKRSFIANQFCVTQRPSHSDIQHCDVNYLDIALKFKKFTAK